MMPALPDGRLLPVTAAYTVRAISCPQIVSRLLGHFAQQNLVPASIRSRCWGDTLAIAIEQPDLSEHQAEVIAEKMRSIVTVTSVSLEYRIGVANPMRTAA